MLSVLVSASDEEIIATLQRFWVKALAEEGYAEAGAMLENSSDWPPDVIQALIENHGTLHPIHQQERYKVTAPETASGVPHHYVSRGEWQTPEGCIGDLSYRLPLNGLWSSLSAVFVLLLKGGRVSFILEGIEVQ